MAQLKGRTALVTGASSGIGRACAEALAEAGAAIIACARRHDRLKALQDEIRRFSVPCHFAPVDVRDRRQVERLIKELPDGFRDIDILINNAGLARGLSPVHEGSLDDWAEMIDTNLTGLLTVTRAVLPGMIQRGRGHIVNIGSIAGRQVYPRGTVYCATKFAVRALTQGLLMELTETPIRVSTVDPGLVQTEFALVRFRGDAARAAQTYADTVPLTPRDIAEAVLFCLTRPPHMNIAEMVVMPTAQGSVYHLHRGAHSAGR